MHHSSPFGASVGQACRWAFCAWLRHYRTKRPETSLSHIAALAREMFMKNIILLYTMVLLSACIQKPFLQNERAFYKAGLVSSFDCEKEEVTDNHPIERESCGKIHVYKELDKVKLFLGENFGVEYWIKGLDNKDCYVVTHYLEHPKMVTPSGDIRHAYKRDMNVGKCNDDDGEYDDVFSWYIGEEWEAVAGTWKFEILLDGKILISKEMYAK